MASTHMLQNNIIFDDSTDSDTNEAPGGAGVSVATSGGESLTQRPGRKRVKNVGLWRSTIAKRLRTAGESYVSRSRNNRTVVPPVSKTARPCHCKRLCFNTITIAMRESVVKDFYKIESKNLQDSYLCGLITPMSIKQRRKRLPGSTKQREGSFLYKVRYIRYNVFIVAILEFGAVNSNYYYYYPPHR